MLEDFKKEIDKVLSGDKTTAISNVFIGVGNVDLYILNAGLAEEEIDDKDVSWDLWARYVRGEDRFQLTSNGCYQKGLIFKRL